MEGKIRLKDSKLTNPIAVGDRVEVGEEDLMIQAVLPRKNYFIRQSPRKTEHFHVIASNIDLAVFVFTKKLPRTSTGFLDRFLVCCEAFDISPLILIHKWDQYDDKEKDQLHELKDLYKGIGYGVLISSVIDGSGMDELPAELKEKTTLFFGHSGSGKSSIMNFLYPDLNLKTSDISGFSKKGKHATTFAQMFDVEGGSRLIDIPGIKEFALDDEIEDYELSHFFPEIKEFGQGCKFHTCLHLNEPDCKVKEAVTTGLINENRYVSYVGLVEKSDFKKR